MLGKNREVYLCQIYLKENPIVFSEGDLHPYTWENKIKIIKKKIKTNQPNTTEMQKTSNAARHLVVMRLPKKRKKKKRPSES